MKLHASVAGHDEIMRALRGLSERVAKRALQDALMESAEPIRQRMETMSKRGDDAPHLKDNIGISRVSRVDGVRLHEDAAAVAIGPTKSFFYGFFLEFGTVKMTPQPFARPAFDIEKGTALKHFAAEVRRMLASKGVSFSRSGGGAPIRGGSGGRSL